MKTILFIFSYDVFAVQQIPGNRITDIAITTHINGRV